MPHAGSPALDASSVLRAAYTTPRSDVANLVPQDAGCVLDVGCSNGALGAALRAMRAVRRVYGVELDPGFAQEAATRLDGVLCADVEAMDWASVHAGNQFDCIVFADVLEHLRDPRRQLAGARARLAPGGCIVTSLPNIRHISAFAAIFLGGHFPARPRGIFDRTHLRWFTIADARAMFAEAGFEIEAMDFAMRKGDQGGGRVNRLLNRLPRALRGWWLLREFFTYQFSFRARVKQ